MRSPQLNGDPCRLQHRAWSVVPRGQALTWFFEGLPNDQSVPWGVWLEPLFWWCTLLAALCAVLLSTVVILRKQWIEYERIDYPLMELPLAMLEEEKASIFRSPLFWVGFGISVFSILWNIGWYFNPSWPGIQYRLKPIDLGRHFQLIRLNLYWPIVGFAYFIKLDVSFSIWFFYLLGILQEGISNRLGLEVKHEDPYGTSFAAVGWQAFGAWVVIVGWGLWIGRRHLGDVFRKAFRNDPTVDDSVEIMSYKAAVRALILGLLYIAGFLYATGMNAWIVPVFIVAMMFTYLGITRIIVETGLITIRAPVVAQHFIQFAIGTAGLSGRTMTALGLSYGWYGDMKTTLMPALGHSVKLLDTVRANKRSLLIALVLAMAVGILSSLVFIIHMAYKTGAGNYGGQLSGDLARLPWDIIVQFTRGPVDTDWTKLTFFGAGIGITVLLYVMRSRFQGWPFHPLGFAAGTCYPVTNVVFPIFLGWMFKSLILRFGGVRLFNVARPVFHGLILGYYCGAGISFFVDMIWFPGHGHGIPFSD